MEKSSNGKTEELRTEFVPFVEKGAEKEKIDMLCECLARFLPYAPVNVLEVADAVGLEVFETDLIDDVSGMLDCKGGKIYLEKEDSGKKQRFSCAHEIEHFLLYDHSDVVLLRSDREIEKEPNSMAAKILMPKCFMEGFVSDQSKETEVVAEQFRVSYDAADCRMRNLGLA